MKAIQILVAMLFVSAAGVVHCAESLTPDDRFIVKGDSIYDTKTRLTWKRCTEGMVWSGATCTGEPDQFYWNEVEKKYGEVTDGWRLPTKDELSSILSGRTCDEGWRHNHPAKTCELDSPDQSIIEPIEVRAVRIVGKTLPSININVFDDFNVIFPMGAPILYWSSTKPPAENSLKEYNPWQVEFLLGTVEWRTVYSDTSHYVRLVRD